MPRAKRQEVTEPAFRFAGPTHQKVCELLVEHRGVDLVECKLDATLVDDLGADSLDAVELEMHLEEQFHIEREVMDEAIAELLDKRGTVLDLVELVERHKRR